MNRQADGTEDEHADFLFKNEKDGQWYTVDNDGNINPFNGGDDLTKDLNPDGSLKWPDEFDEFDDSNLQLDWHQPDLLARDETGSEPDHVITLPHTFHREVRESRLKYVAKREAHLDPLRKNQVVKIVEIVRRKVLDPAGVHTYEIIPELKGEWVATGIVAYAKITHANNKPFGMQPGFGLASIEVYKIDTE